MNVRLWVLVLTFAPSFISGSQAQADSRQDASLILEKSNRSRANLDRLWSLEGDYFSSDSRFVVLSKEIENQAKLSLVGIASLEAALTKNPSQIKAYIEIELKKIESNVEVLRQYSQESQKLANSAMISAKSIVGEELNDAKDLEQPIAFLAKDFMRRVSGQSIENDRLFLGVKQSLALVARKVSRYLIMLAAETSHGSLKKALYEAEAHLSYQAHLSPLIREMRLFDSLLDRQILAFLIFRSEQTLSEMHRLKDHFDDVLASMVLPAAMKQEAAQTIEQLLSQAKTKLDGLRALGQNKLDLVLKAKRRAQRLVARACRNSNQSVDCDLYDVLVGVDSNTLETLPEATMRQYEFAWDYLRGQVQI